MNSLKKMGMCFTSVALGWTLFAPIGNAQSIIPEQDQRIQIQIASTETTVTKEELIKKLKALFPNKFNYLKNNDFQMNTSRYYMDDGIERYELSFNKTINGKAFYGNVVFAGDNLDLENFYYNPTNTTDALFPAKVSKKDAQKIAESILKRFSNFQDYILDENTANYFPQQLLTEPIRYSFSFVRTASGIPISDQRIEITVLGNGEIVNLYKSPLNFTKYTFDDVNSKKSEDVILQQLKKNISAQLRYQVNFDYAKGDRTISLVYVPSSNPLNIHAISGKWQRPDGSFVDKFDTEIIEPLTTTPLQPKNANITLEQAKKLAQDLLAIQSDKFKLVIQSVNEIENINGQTVYSIQYMYESQYGGSGSNIEINKNTGEITQYFDMKDDILKQAGQTITEKPPLSKELAYEKALQYLKEFAPSYLHHYAKPIQDPSVDQQRGYTMFTFPRIVNGILVDGDQINIAIKSDGTLGNLSIGYQEIEWPSIEGTITKEQATKAFLDNLSVKLEYVRDNVYAKPSADKQDQYELIYKAIFNKDNLSYLDAKTGEWKSLLGAEKMTNVVSHPKAEAELNYLIGADILQIKDVKKFNADAPITQGEALSVLMKSITHFYTGFNERKVDETGEPIGTIDVKNPLYAVVERAVAVGVLDDAATGFVANAPITRQELAKWYISALNLDIIAEHPQIFKLNFSDANQVNKAFIGYVALADTLQLLPIENNKFKPNEKVSYADLAISTIQLAKKINEKGLNINY